MLYRHLCSYVEETTSAIGEQQVIMPLALFRRILTAALKGKHNFDERYYLDVNPDVQDAIKNKKIASAADHYYETGYFEGRLPRRVLVDAKFYLNQNPDVADAIRRGKIKDAQEHFDAAGFREGRLPHEGFSMF